MCTCSISYNPTSKAQYAKRLWSADDYHANYYGQQNSVYGPTAMYGDPGVSNPVDYNLLKQSQEANKPFARAGSDFVSIKTKSS